MQEDWVPIEPPENLEEMFEAMTSYEGDRIGWCLLCNSPIHTEADVIPRTSTNNCEQGRELEAEIESQRPTTRRKAGRRGNPMTP